MNLFLTKNYKALLIGGIVTILVMLFLRYSQIHFFVVNPDSVSPFLYTSINLISLLFFWLLVSLVISKFPLYKILGIVSLLVVAILAELYLPFTDNLITIPLVILFWIGVTFLILPQFFRKYKIAILIVYGLVISYFFFDFITTINYTQNNREHFAHFILIPIPFFAALWLYEQWRWLKMLKADKASAELALLKTQINPHFFFNTLNNLYGLVVEKSDNAPEMVLKLSEMMRYTIYEGKEELILLKDEINYLKNYIELHKIRYQKTVDITFIYDVDETLKVPPLLFIILLENAFKHGVEKIRQGAYIFLDMKSEGNALFCTIENNFDSSEVHHTQGIGLENLKKRLAYSFPNNHELIIEKKESIYKVQLNLKLV
ncbi:histidine kinase [Aquimarina sp. D1M17]|uniref:sensor histidine kinase n=1 Tax=Aquimarina acroporae TaxID=2937283 RepID=UPI0020BE11EC|nr:histidine kinase [Aquimarina acroporae]MCK8522978.1 histidine kinase [Aquimarina acroporae]